MSVPIFDMSLVPALEHRRFPGSAIKIKIPIIPIGDPDTPNWQRFFALCQTPEQQTVLRLPGIDVPYHPLQVTRELLESQRPTAISATLAQRSGTISSYPCRNCTGSSNAFPICRAIHNHFGGSCGNCIWRNDAQSCCRSYPSASLSHCLSQLADATSIRQLVFDRSPSASSHHPSLINSASAPPASQPALPSSHSFTWRTLVLNPSPSPSAASPLLPTPSKSTPTHKRLSKPSSPLQDYNDDDQELSIPLAPLTPVLSRKRPRVVSPPFPIIIPSVEEPSSPTSCRRKRLRPQSYLHPATLLDDDIQILSGPPPNFSACNRSLKQAPSLGIDGFEEVFVTPAPRKSPRGHKSPFHDSLHDS